ncbi:MAG: transglycosylase domain-containing protein [Paracoccaceae bacterium]
MAKRKREQEATKKPTLPPQPGLIGRAVRGLLRLIWGAAWRLVMVLLLILGTATGIYYSQLPNSEDLFDGRGTGSVTMRDQSGAVFAWRGEQYGGELRVADVSPHLINAVIAAEDKRYYGHIGIDPRGIARAMYQNFKAGRLVQGGSTLTQQVAKNVFLDAERSLERKVKELPMALALELKYSKEEILSVYLNRVYLGAGTHGFEAASQRYFGTSARVLSPAEAAMLAGLLRAPSRYAPTNDLARAQGRASVIVRLMEDQGYLTQGETIEALSNPAVLSEAAAARAGGAFADWIMEDGGQDQFLDLLKAADVEIETTFEPRIQRMAEAALADVFARKVREGSEAQAAIVIMDYDGSVRAIVGGRERGAARFNRATQALRQTGSVFKPIVYAAGLEKGLTPLDIFQDVPITIGNWSPKNYGGKYRGPVTLREALARSINTVAVRVSEQTGRARVRDMARDMGLTTDLAPGPAVALGTSEARLIEMVGAFATIANGGNKATPHGVRAIRLRGDATPIDSRRPGPGDRVLGRTTAGLLTHMMQTVVSNGTGKRAKLAGWEVAGKTGTTQKARDAWFIGYTSDFVAGVWMGYDDNRPLTGVTGGGLPAEIWAETMKRLHAGREPKPLNSIQPVPAQPQVVLAPQPVPQRSPERSPSPSSNETVVEQVFREVLDVLGGGGGESQRNPDFNPVSGNDR